MKKFLRYLTAICISILIFILIGCTDLYSSNWTIKATDQTKTVGRVSYIELKITTQTGIPVFSTQIKIMYKKADQWETFKDALTGKEVFTTNENGIVKISILSSKEETWQFYVYVVDNPSIKTEFTVSFKKPQWFFMIWMCADNNLEEYALKDIEEMKNVNNNASIFLIYDGKLVQDSFFVMDELGNWIKFETFQNDLDSGDSSLLSQWLVRVFGEYEANNYSLILWDHGSAWVYDSVYTKQIAVRAIAFDDTSKNAISTANLRKALEDFSNQTGKRINLLGMDACLMGSIEVLYELKDVVDYIVASSFSIPTDGWNYLFFNLITSTDNTFSIAKKIVDTYKSYYQNSSRWKSLGLSLAVYDIEKMSQTADLLSNLSDKLIQLMDNSLKAIINGFYEKLVQYYLGSSTGQPLNILVDLNDFASQIENISNDDVKQLTLQLKDSLKDFIVYYYVEKTSFQIKYPVSIFMPKDISIFNSCLEDYDTLLFKNLSWDDFLKSWLSP